MAGSRLLDSVLSCYWATLGYLASQAVQAGLSTKVRKELLQTISSSLSGRSLPKVFKDQMNQQKFGQDTICYHNPNMC